MTYSTNKLLHEKDIEHYNTQGYLTGIRIFAKDEADNPRDYFDKLLSQVMVNGGNLYSISTAHLAYGRVWDLLNNTSITAYVADIWEPDLIR